MNTKRTIFLKCLLTGLIYAVITCIVQVPVANVLLPILHVPLDTSIPADAVPMLLLSLFFVGAVMALFYYLYEYLFASASKWKNGMTFSLFVCFSNYIPQVFFLDAAKGFNAIITGGFTVIQVEVFDLLILIGTALLMVRYMPYRDREKAAGHPVNWWKCIVCGGVFAASLFFLHELILPLLGFGSMASGLGVAEKDLPFFYSVLLAGFVLAGVLVSYHAYQVSGKREQGRFFMGYGIMIWCTFALTMIPLGFGVATTVVFCLISLAAFLSSKSVFHLWNKT